MHRGQQEYGIHDWETYAPVVTWQTLRVFMILSLIHGWVSCQLDFVMAYPQAPAEKPLYMRLPQGYHCKGITKDTRALKLIRNVYGPKQAGRVWNKYLDEGMNEVGSTPSDYDLCLHYKKHVVMLIYIDDH